MKNTFLLLLLLFIFSCNNRPPEIPQYKPVKDILVTLPDTLQTIITEMPDTMELKFLEMGLVNVQLLDFTIRVNLRYSSVNNFFGLDVYGNLEKAYLQPDVARKLSCAQEYLHALYPLYNLLIYDAARPVYVQQIMWDTVKMPVIEKTKYLSNPRRGSLHNYGAAVDITIADSMNIPLDMGTDFDYFGELAYPTKEHTMLQKGLLTNEQVNNRKLLRSVMSKAGFFNIQTEWWHFNSCTRYEAEQKYKIIK